MRTHWALTFILALAAAVSPKAAFAQFTLVSGTVTDTNGLAYACGQITATIVNNNGQNLYLSGLPFSALPATSKLGCPTDPTTSSTAGAFTFQLADNTQIKCGSGAAIVSCATQTTWQINVSSTGTPPPLGTGPQTCTATLTISGSVLRANSAQYGGSIFNDGTSSGKASLVVSNTTLSANSASGDGGTAGAGEVVTIGAGDALDDAELAQAGEVSGEGCGRALGEEW